MPLPLQQGYAHGQHLHPQHRAENQALRAVPGTLYTDSSDGEQRTEWTDIGAVTPRPLPCPADGAGQDKP